MRKTPTYQREERTLYCCTFSFPAPGAAFHFAPALFSLPPVSPDRRERRCWPLFSDSKLAVLPLFTGAATLRADLSAVLSCSHHQMGMMRSPVARRISCPGRAILFFLALSRPCPVFFFDCQRAFFPRSSPRFATYRCPLRRTSQPIPAAQAPRHIECLRSFCFLVSRGNGRRSRNR